MIFPWPSMVWWPQGTNPTSYQHLPKNPADQPWSQSALAACPHDNWDQNRLEHVGKHEIFQGIMGMNTPVTMDKKVKGEIWWISYTGILCGLYVGVIWYSQTNLLLRFQRMALRILTAIFSRVSCKLSQHPFLGLVVAMWISLWYHLADCGHLQLAQPDPV